MNDLLRRVGMAPLALALLTALALPLTGVNPASASVEGGPLPTAKVNCVAFAADGTCDVKGVVYAMTQVGDLT